MMKVDETNLVAVEYPPNPSALEISGPPNTVVPVSQPSFSVEPTTPASSTDPATLKVLSAIAQMLSQLSSITSRLDKLEQPATAPYSPSRLAGTSASLWAPSRSHRPKPGDRGFVPCDEPWDASELPVWVYGTEPFTTAYSQLSEEDFYASHPEPVNDWPVSYLISLYKSHFHIPHLSVLTDSQQLDVLALPGIFQLFTDHKHIPFDHSLNSTTEF